MPSSHLNLCYSYTRNLKQAIKMHSKNILTKKWMSCPSELCNIRKSITDACKQLAFCEQDINAIVLAIDEACTNIIRYAYKDCSDGEILIEVDCNNQQAIFRLHDHAKKVTNDCIKLRPSSPLKPGGLGVMLMKEVMDSVDFIHTENCPGNILEMKKELPKENN